ncbi:piggyBac transposable element-derived protein 4-like [Pararge aegeria]|uniref:piggyBac transposable element-derived protein 4-like n=1 Tax=Pararge aegeria TaxID=116150 RepID=UPI0019CFF8B0|nr:piggyBac transposable element-derived protein 4-like [Pararge aegeria]
MESNVRNTTPPEWEATQPIVGMEIQISPNGSLYARPDKTVYMEKSLSGSLHVLRTTANVEESSERPRIRRRLDLNSSPDLDAPGPSNEVGSQLLRTKANVEESSEAPRIWRRVDLNFSPDPDVPGPSNEPVRNVARESYEMQQLRMLNFEDESDSVSPIPSHEVVNTYLTSELAEALAVDSGSEDDEEDDLDENDLRRILEIEEEGEEIEERGEEEVMLNYDFTWSQNFEEFTGTEERFEVQPGPTVQEDTPIKIFKSIWDRSVMEKIVKETNYYAWQKIAAAAEVEDGIKPKSRLYQWEDTTVAELYKFFGIMIYMGICYRSRIDEYWTTGILGMPEFRKLMSKNRFLLLLRFLHFVDNDELGPNIRGYERKVSKVVNIVEHCNKKFGEIYIPHRAISIDESLLLWKGRLSWIQCIRSKAARFGIKTYELCEAETGYLITVEAVMDMSQTTYQLTQQTGLINVKIARNEDVVCNA